MRKHKLERIVTAWLLVAAMVVCFMPVRAEAASSSEIRNQINELKAEKNEIQAQLNEIRGQYQQNADEMQDMVDQKNLIDQEIALLHEQISNINDQIASFSLLIADKQDELDAAQERLAELNEKNKERIQAMEEEGALS